MRQKIVYILSILFAILVILWIVLLKWNVVAKAEPIQEILNQIQTNESELQQLEIRQNELNQWTAMLKEELFVKYWLQLSEIKKTDYDVEWCSRAYDVSVKQIQDWVSTAEIQREVLEEEWCPESYKERLQVIWNERTPWKLNESWDAQEMPIVEWNDSHEKFKNLAIAYWLDASQIRAVENHYWITEWVILCITVAETSWWNRWAWWKNIWSVWSNDRWERPTYALMESWLEDIWKTLTNRYLWKKQTLWCLSNAWSCKETNDNWKRYATSESHREKNMTACLSTIYWSIDPATFSIRR